MKNNENRHQPKYQKCEKSKMKETNTLKQSIDCFDTKYREKGMQSQRSYPSEPMIQFIASNYFSVPPEERKDIRVLEVGSGSGANLWMLAKEGFDTYGLDSSEKGLELAKAHLKNKWDVVAKLTKGSFTELPYDDNYFDAVVDVVSLQHINLKDSEKALFEINRILKKGGRFFSYRLSDQSIMFKENVGELVDSATLLNIEPPMPLSNNGPMSFWSIDLANSMYKKANLEIDSIEKVKRTYAEGHVVEYLCISSVSRK